DHPGQGAAGEAEVLLDRGQRDVDDRRVQDHHELSEADQDEDRPVARGPAEERRRGGSGAGHDALVSGTAGARRARVSRSAIMVRRRPWWRAAARAVAVELFRGCATTSEVP